MALFSLRIPVYIPVFHILFQKDNNNVGWIGSGICAAKNELSRSLNFVTGPNIVSLKFLSL